LRLIEELQERKKRLLRGPIGLKLTADSIN